MSSGKASSDQRQAKILGEGTACTKALWQSSRKQTLSGRTLEWGWAWEEG